MKASKTFALVPALVLTMAVGLFSADESMAQRPDREPPRPEREDPCPSDRWHKQFEVRNDQHDRAIVRLMTGAAREAGHEIDPMSITSGQNDQFAVHIAVIRDDGEERSGPRPALFVHLDFRDVEDPPPSGFYVAMLEEHVDMFLVSCDGDEVLRGEYIVWETPPETVALLGCLGWIEVGPNGFCAGTFCCFGGTGGTCIGHAICITMPGVPR